jgi:hypothetical protein
MSGQKMTALGLGVALLMIATAGHLTVDPNVFASPRRASKAEMSQAEKETSNRVRLAEGEYRVNRLTNDGGIGPFDPAVHDFKETWTLWRIPDGTLEADGERNYEAPQYETHKDSFAVHLSAKFKVMRITEYKRLRWRPDSGPLACDFLPGRLECESGARSPSQEVRLSLPFHVPYGFLWPISAFSVSNITRFADREKHTAIPVDMLTIDEPDRADPVMATVLEGRLRYLGQEQTTIAGRKWLADEFELKVPLHPAFMIWTSAQGLLLDFALENNQGRLTEEGMELVKYQQSAEY